MTIKRLMILEGNKEDITGEENSMEKAGDKKGKSDQKNGENRR